MTSGTAVNFPEPRYVDTNGVRLAVFEAKPARRTTNRIITEWLGRWF